MSSCFRQSGSCTHQKLSRLPLSGESRNLEGCHREGAYGAGALRRQRRLQYLTLSQFLAHFFRQVMGRPQVRQVLAGRCCFLTPRMVRSVSLEGVEEAPRLSLNVVPLVRAQAVDAEHGGAGARVGLQRRFVADKKVPI